MDLVFDVVIGCLLGVGTGYIGIWLYGIWPSWARSVDETVGDRLKGGSYGFFLLRAGVIAGVLEELPIRGGPLFLYLSVPSLGIGLALLFNFIWAVTHKNDKMPFFKMYSKENFSMTIPHHVVLFLNGFLFIAAAFYTKNILVPILMHGLCNVVFGTYYRRRMYAF